MWSWLGKTFVNSFRFICLSRQFLSRFFPVSVALRWGRAETRKLRGRMALQTLRPTRSVCRTDTTTTIRAAGGRSGANTGTSSTPCSVSTSSCLLVYIIYKQVVHAAPHVDLFPTENREDMLSPSTDKLTEVLEEANKLFKDGGCHGNHWKSVMGRTRALLFIFCIQNKMLQRFS